MTFLTCTQSVLNEQMLINVMQLTPQLIGSTAMIRIMLLLDLPSSSEDTGYDTPSWGLFSLQDRGISLFTFITSVQ